MSTTARVFASTIALASALLQATTAHASVLQVPEPTTLSLLAAGAAAAVIGVKLRKRK